MEGNWPMTINIILNITNKMLCQETPKSMLMASACQHKLVSTQQLEKIEERDHEKVLLSIFHYFEWSQTQKWEPQLHRMQY